MPTYEYELRSRSSLHQVSSIASVYPLESIDCSEELPDLARPETKRKIVFRFYENYGETEVFLRRVSPSLQYETFEPIVFTNQETFQNEFAEKVKANYLPATYALVYNSSMKPTDPIDTMAFGFHIDHPKYRYCLRHRHVKVGNSGVIMLEPINIYVTQNGDFGYELDESESSETLDEDDQEVIVTI